MFIQTWFLPFALFTTATIIAFPLSSYIAWIMDGKYRPLPIFRWFEKSLNSGPQNWMQYTGSLLLFNTILFIYGYFVLAIQPYAPLNPDGKTTPVSHHYFPQRLLFYDQYRPPTLCRRSEFIQFQPNFLLHRQSFFIRCHWL